MSRVGSVGHGVVDVGREGYGECGVSLTAGAVRLGTGVPGVPPTAARQVHATHGITRCAHHVLRARARALASTDAPQRAALPTCGGHIVVSRHRTHAHHAMHTYAARRPSHTLRATPRHSTPQPPHLREAVKLWDQQPLARLRHERDERVADVGQHHQQQVDRLTGQRQVLGADGLEPCVRIVCVCV